MSKGISSAHTLKSIVHVIQQFVDSWSEGNQKRNKSAGNGEWPAPYRLAALKGEAVLRQQFFGNFISSLPHQPDPAQQLALWNALVEQSGALADFVQRIGIKAALRREATLPEHLRDETRMFYAILCHALSEAKPGLLAAAVDQFMLFQWKQQFPATPVARSARRSTPEELREKLAVALRRHYKRSVEIRESFDQTSAAVDFKILCRKTPGEPWGTLVSLSRPRLSTARAAAYAAALAGNLDIVVGVKA